MQKRPLPATMNGSAMQAATMRLAAAARAGESPSPVAILREGVRHPVERDGIGRDRAAVDAAVRFAELRAGQVGSAAVTARCTGWSGRT